MNDAEAIRFVNEQIRPLAETYLALIYKVQAMREHYDLLYSLFHADSAAAVEDGREDDGVSRLTCGDIEGFANNIIGKTDANALDAGARALITKICVRELTIR